MKNFLQFFDKSIKRLVMSSFIFVLLLPMGFFVYSLFVNSWDQAKQDMLQKHELIAKSMVEPFTIFITSKQHTLNSVGEDIYGESQDSSLSSATKKKKIQKSLNQYMKSHDDLVSISYFPASDLSTRYITSRQIMFTIVTKPNYNKIPMYRIPSYEGNKRETSDLLSTVFRSKVSNEPVILLKHYVLDDHNKIAGTLFAEFSLDYIGNMCSKINFGVKGHCAVVDRNGRVVAHPNKKWVQEIRNISKISVVKKMMRGEHGTTVFYSPFLKADMVAGFTSVPKLGWGIMIPQPKAELTKTIDDVVKNTLIWFSLGILVALFIAVLLTRKITYPINCLVKRAREIDSGYDNMSLGRLPEDSPSEIKQLWISISTLLKGLQQSNKEVKKLNVSLNREVLRATDKLRATNKHLYEISSQDYLTSLANRRYFTSTMEKVLRKRSKESVGIIMMDIDKFKFINDEYGHEAGDMALKHIAKIVLNSTRQCDMAARLGGDEFILYIKNTTDKTLAMIAEKLRVTVAQSPLKLADKTINLTLSIGTVNYVDEAFVTLEKLLSFADKAMYQSKESGRNQVSAYSFDDQQSDTTESAVETQEADVQRDSQQEITMVLDNDSNLIDVIDEASVPFSSDDLLQVDESTESIDDDVAQLEYADDHSGLPSEEKVEADLVDELIEEMSFNLEDDATAKEKTSHDMAIDLESSDAYELFDIELDDSDVTLKEDDMTPVEES